MTTNNHPAHGPVSLDRLHQIREILSKAAAQSDGGNLGYAMADAVKVIDGAIAAFDVDPISQCDSRKQFEEHFGDGTTPGMERVPPFFVEMMKDAFWTVWEDSRAVMLQAGSSPSKCSLRDGIEAIRNSGIPVDVDKIQSECEAGNHTEQHLDMVDHFVDANEKGKDGTLINEGTMPAMQIKPVADLYLITYEDGSPYKYTHEAGEATDAIGSGFQVEEFVSLENHRAAMLQAGNSPVAPDGLLGCGENCWSCGKYFTYEQHSECDGYCPHCNSPVDLDDEEEQSSKVVPTEPTEEMIYNAWREAIGKCDHETIKRIYATMLAAAPQQEVK